MTVDLRAGGTEYWIAKIKLNGIFPYATRIELTRGWLEVEGAPLLPMPGLDHALAVLTTVWGSQTQFTPEFSPGGRFLRIERGSETSVAVVMKAAEPEMKPAR